MLLTIQASRMYAKFACYSTTKGVTMSFFNTILEKLGLRKAQPAPAKVPAGVSAGASVGAPKEMSEVDVVKKLEGLSAGKGLNWKVSIVDLLKVLDIDSSLEARKELA